MTSTPNAAMPRQRAIATPGELKQAILRVYNATNQSVWGAGVREQQVELLGDRILIVAWHQRVPALASLDRTQRSLTREVDAALIDEFKRRITVALRDELGLDVRAVLKDYDPDTQLACTFVLLDQQLSFGPMQHVLSTADAAPGPTP